MEKSHGIFWNANLCLVPDSETLQAMIRRERKLRLSPLCQRAYCLPLASRRDINRQIRLRVVREFNLPDSIAEVLESAAYQFAEEATETSASSSALASSAKNVWERRPVARAPLPPKRMTSRTQSRGLQQQHLAGSLSALDLPHLDDEQALLAHHFLHHNKYLPQFCNIIFIFIILVHFYKCKNISFMILFSLFLFNFINKITSCIY